MSEAKKCPKCGGEMEVGYLYNAPYWTHGRSRWSIGWSGRVFAYKCKACGYWNRIEVNKLFIKQETSEPGVKTIIPMYEPLRVETCKKCKNIIAEPKELIRIVAMKK